MDAEERDRPGRESALVHLGVFALATLLGTLACTFLVFSTQLYVSRERAFSAVSLLKTDNTEFPPGNPLLAKVQHHGRLVALLLLSGVAIGVIASNVFGPRVRAGNASSRVWLLAPALIGGGAFAWAWLYVLACLLP